jgi:GR25 family glycosyltransferase involved in LPS biosynthesis
MAHVRIISIENPTPSAFYVTSVDYRHSKFVHRKKYVNDILIPSLKKANRFDSVESFPAVTPSDFNIVGRNIIYKDKVFNVGENTCYIGNFLSHYMVWNSVIELNGTVLILEDDALLPESNLQNVISSIKRYEEICKSNPNTNYLLYLLSMIPRSNTIKLFSKSNLTPYTENMFRWSPLTLGSDPGERYEDIAGGAAYLINPNTAKALCTFAKTTPADGVERVFGMANTANITEILVPSQFNKSFILNEQTESWESVHKIVTPPKWNELPAPVQSAYRMNNTIKLENWYIDNVNDTKEKFTIEQVESFIEGAKKKQYNVYGVYDKTDKWLYEALDIIPIKNQKVAIIGSVRPWYESMTIAYGGFPTTIEYNLPEYNYPLIKEILWPEVLRSGETFDMGMSISSFEHDGLGRYGDPLNPNGDLLAMFEMKRILKPGGILFLAVPCGLDKIVWNAHRIYGNQRLKLLLNGWEVLGTVGYESEMLFVDTGNSGSYQPLFVLKNT